MDYWLCVSVCLCVSTFSRERHNVLMLRASLSEISGYFTSMYGPNGNISSSLLIVYNTVPCSAPLRTRLNISEWNCLAVHWMGALWVMSAGPNEDYQGMAYHPALRHAQDVSAVSQSPLSERTQRVEHWRCSRMPIVLASDDMQATAVEAVDTAHQRPCLGRMCQCGTHCDLVCSHFLCPRESVVGRDVWQWAQRRLP